VGRTIRSEIHKLLLILYGKRRNCLEEWKESIIVPIYKNGAKTDCSNYRGISFLPTTCKILSNILLPRLTPYAEELIGIINVDFDTIGQLLIIHSAFIIYLRKNEIQ